MYRIKDWTIYDNNPENIQGYRNGYYIREILDGPSWEYKTSELSAKEKYEIILDLGLDNLKEILKEVFQESNRPYDADRVAVMTYEFLRIELGIGDWESLEGRLKKALGQKNKK